MIPLQQTKLIISRKQVICKSYASCFHNTLDVMMDFNILQWEKIPTLPLQFFSIGAMQEKNTWKNARNGACNPRDDCYYSFFIKKYPLPVIL